MNDASNIRIDQSRKTMVQRHESISTTFPEVKVEANSAVAVPTTGGANEGRWLSCK